jgi:hypothetical protein
MKQYVLANVDFTWPVEHAGDEDTVVLTEKNIRTNLKNIRKVMGINDPTYGELNAWKYIYDDIDDNEWAVLHHHRRKANQLYENNYNIPESMFFDTSVCKQTEYYHTRTMVDLLHQVLNPMDFSILEGNEFVPYNIFLVDRPMLKSWLDYVTGKISAIKQIIGPLDKFLLNDRDLWVSRPGKNMEYDYQKRFFGFILERLNTVWWIAQVTNGVTVYPTHINKMNTNI